MRRRDMSQLREEIGRQVREENNERGRHRLGPRGVAAEIELNLKIAVLAHDAADKVGRKVGRRIKEWEAGLSS